MNKPFSNSLFSGLTRRERWGSLIVLLIATACILLPRIAGMLKGPVVETVIASTALPGTSADDHGEEEFFTDSRSGKKHKKLHLKYATVDELVAVGIKPEIAQQLHQQYQQGQRLGSMAELATLTHLETALLEKHISPKSFKDYYSKNQPHFEESGEETTPEPETFKTPQGKSYRTVSINNCDTADLKALPGIGSKTALRLINYRNKLGGFISFAQLKETFGVDTSTLNKLQPYLLINSTDIHKLSLNRATEKQLAGHPYCKGYQAKGIISYIAMHGHITPADMHKLKVFTPAELARLLPYLEE